ncbi:hypothetical protein ACFPYJ_18245 [Paenibacillus solisilvae]|uniref:DUF3387 domain-containing protein n=1 Tax=Paenibacillus solisilvae TaxID=2486751 RepID=A0ABW0W2S6_9BACL
MADEGRVFTREEVEEAKKEEIRELLIQAFDGQSVLYEIYKKRGWLERILTDKILSMDPEALYISSQVAEICETQDYVIKNKRRDLLDYINPTTMGEGNSKIYKHNYISVFKIKMIIGLTGEGSEYTLPQLKELIYGNITKPAAASDNKAGESNNDLLFQVMKQMDQFKDFYKLIQSGDFFKEVEDRAKAAAQSAAQTLMLESRNDEEVKLQIDDLYQKINAADTSIAEKELLLEKFSELEQGNPSQAFTIRMYKNAAEDRVTKFKQDERELHISKIKERILELFETFENAASENERESIREQLQQISKENTDLHFEIRYWLSTTGKEKKRKGFFGRLFSS